MRWSGRRVNQQQWVPPDLAHRPRPLSVLSHYSDPEYVIGNSTAEELERIARLFKSGNDSEPQSLAELSTNSREYLPLTGWTTRSKTITPIEPTEMESLEFHSTRPSERPPTRSIVFTPMEPAELEANEAAELPASFAFRQPSPTWSASQTDESNKHYRGKGKNPETPTSSGEAGEGGFF